MNHCNLQNDAIIVLLIDLHDKRSIFMNTFLMEFILFISKFLFNISPIGHNYLSIYNFRINKVIAI